MALADPTPLCRLPELAEHDDTLFVVSRLGDSNNKSFTVRCNCMVCRVLCNIDVRSNDHRIDRAAVRMGRGGHDVAMCRFHEGTTLKPRFMHLMRLPDDEYTKLQPVHRLGSVDQG